MEVFFKHFQFEFDEICIIRKRCIRYKDVAKIARNKLVEFNLIQYSVQQMHVLLLLPGNG